MSGQQEIDNSHWWREKVYIFVMPVSRLHKLNITLRPHTLDCDGEINRDTPDKIVLHSWMMTRFWIKRHNKFFDDFSVINGHWAKRYIIFYIRDCRGYPVWYKLIYCARPSHNDRHFVCTASCVKTTLALITKKLGCQEIETNISSAYGTRPFSAGVNMWSYWNYYI